MRAGSYSGWGRNSGATEASQGANTPPSRRRISMFKRLARRPTPAMLVALVALFAATAGVSYAATQGPPSFTAHGVAYVPASSINGVVLPLSGTNASALSNHGMTLAGTTQVTVPTAGHYLLTLAGNCNGGATGTRLTVREGP